MKMQIIWRKVVQLESTSVLAAIAVQDQHLMDFLPQDSELLPFKNLSSLVILFKIHGAFYSLITTEIHGQAHVLQQQNLELMSRKTGMVCSVFWH